MKYLLDTNACIGLIKNRSTVVARAAIVSPDDCAVSAVTVYELFHGAEKARAPNVERQHVETLLATVAELPFGSRAAEAAAKVRAALESTGKGRRINNCRSRSRQTSDLNSGEFSYIRQLFLRRP